MTILTVDINYHGTTNYVDYKRFTRSVKDRKIEIHKGIDSSINRKRCVREQEETLTSRKTNCINVGRTN